MKYQRPEIVAAMLAVTAIQGSMNKAPLPPIDNVPQNATSSAYEADE